MDIAKLVLEYIRVFIWPIVAIAVVFRYGHFLLHLLEKAKVKLFLFGIECEINIADLERSLTAASGGSLTDQQWSLLERIERDHAVSIEKEGYKMNIPGDLEWIRPVRNAGLIMTLPDGKYIEQATDLVLTPLGKLLIKAKRRRSAEMVHEPRRA